MLLKPSPDMDKAIASMDIEKAVEKAMADRGIALPPPPQWGDEVYQGVLPQHYGSFSEDQLSDLMGVITQHKNFLRGQLAKYKGCLDYVKAQKRLAQAYLRKQYRESPELGEGDAKWLVDDYLEMDERFQVIGRDILYFKSFTDLIAAAYDAAESDFNAVSRIITLRGQAREGEQRARGGQYGRGGARGRL